MDSESPKEGMSPPQGQSPNFGRALPTVPGAGPSAVKRFLPAQKTRSNTTSTVFLKNTPTKPDTKELLGCLTEELSKRIEASQGYDYADDEFDERKYVADPSTVAKVPPSKDAIRAFITKVFKEAEVGEEVIVMASVYLSRLTRMTPVRLAPTNWRLLVLCCFMLASKVWEEEAVWNEDFLALFPAIGVKRFAALELHMLNAMQFEVCVNASTYTTAYFELTSLSTEKRDWKKTPLTKDEARDLEIRTLNLETKSKASLKQKRRMSDATHVKVNNSNVILG